jgi:ATP-binding cassette, subfamily B, bacterial
MRARPRRLGSTLRQIGAAWRLCWQAGRVWAAAYAAVTVLSAAIPATTAWLVKLLLDGLAHGPGRVPIPGLVATLAGVGVLTAVLPRLGEYLRAALNRRIDLRMQDQLYAAVNRFDGLSRLEDPAFRDKLELASQATGVGLAPTTTGLYDIGRSLLALTSLLATLAVLSPVMAALVLAAAIPSLLAELSLSRRRVDLTVGLSGAIRRRFFFASLLVDPRAAKEIRLFGLTGFLTERMRHQLTRAHRAEQRLDGRVLRTQTLLALLAAATAGIGLTWAVSGATIGQLTIGDVSAFIAGIGGVQGALSALIDQLALAYQALGGYGLYREVIAERNDLAVHSQPVALPPLRRGIELRDVWFRYGSGQPWALRGVSLTIPHGAAVALVGVNGAGKSTIVKLLCRLYDPSHGMVLWDGVDIRSVPVAELRRRIGVLFQDFMTYDLTAAENIGVGNLDQLADWTRISTAARHADVHETISALPDGYQTLLSRVFAADHDAAGVTLSGGQWQRVALARTFMRERHDLLILDEPSAGLDPEAEHAIHQGLRKLRIGQTSVLISHRLGAIREADIIVVLADGRIVEHGSHTDLLARGGAYARLFNLQAKAYAQPQQPDSLLPGTAAAKRAL